MALQRAEILTPWEQVEEEGTIMRWPLVTSAYSLRTWTDITGQDAANLLPSPNLVSILATADETVIAQIAEDERFFCLTQEYV